MPLICPKPTYLHRIRWTIRNFPTCPSWNDLVITSPEFDVRLLDVLTLKFSLQYQASDHSMLFAVHCVKGVNAYREQRPSLRVSVTVPVAERPSTDARRVVRAGSRPLIPNAPVYFNLEEVRPRMPLKDGLLVLHVSLHTTVDQSQYWAAMLNPHLVALSNDLVSMVTRPAYTNIYVTSSQNYNFDAHTCMLRARVPAIYRRGEVSLSDTGSSSDDSGRPAERDVRVFGTGMSTEATRTLLFYLYGRMASPVPEPQRLELLNFARSYELRDLENMVTLYPTEYLLGTNLVEEEMGFNIAVADLKEKSSMPKMWIPDAKVIKTSVSYTVSEDLMELDFSLDSFPQTPVNMKLTISLQNEAGETLNQHELWHTFVDKKTWTAPKFTALGLADVHLIACRVRVVEGRFDHKEAVNHTREQAGGRLLFNNTLEFSEQLKKLYEDEVGCDFELHIGTYVINVHKAIVVARSPLIWDKVKEQEDKPRDRSVTKVELDEDFPVDLYEEVVLYMYCGRINVSSLQHIGVLSDVADYLDMPFLVEHLIFLTK